MVVSEETKKLFHRSICVLYPENPEEAEKKFLAWLEKFTPIPRQPNFRLNETDIILIAYGDSIRKKGEKPLYTLNRFLSTWAGNAITGVHLLPIYPWSSDDGFSVADYRSVDPILGDWTDVESLAKNYFLMLDAVINHASTSCEWFREFLNQTSPYRDYFITADPSVDYHRVTRPRTTPLLTSFETRNGTRHVWTTFSADQADLNYHSVDLLIEMLDVLLFYARKGARFLRLDAAGFIWKKTGTVCQGLPETHELIRFFRRVLDVCAPGTLPVTETNVPHAENIRYFGDGDEASMVYQFPLPPLTLHAFLSGNAEILSNWLNTLVSPPSGSTFFNFLASHDGIGLRPVEGILSDRDKKLLLEKSLEHGGKISYRIEENTAPSPYELNISYFDALSGDDEPEALQIRKFLAAHCLLVSLAGVPGIYIHSLLGSRNDVAGMKHSGINRRINREKLDADVLENELKTSSIRRQVFRGLCDMLRLRGRQPAFSPHAGQEILRLDPRIVSVVRKENSQHILVLINVSNEGVSVPNVPDGIDIFSGRSMEGDVELEPYGYMWVRF